MNGAGSWRADESPGRLEGRTAIVTGAAGGIGAAIALALARHGASVTVADIIDEGGYSTAEAITGQGGVAVSMVLDVRDRGAWARVTERTVRQFGSLDVLVNNAGVSGVAGAADPFDFATWRYVTDVNLEGTFNGCAAVVPGMAARGGGSIVNISSIAGLLGPPTGHVAYAASKGGVRLLTKAIAAQFGPFGVRCNAVLPGWMPAMRGGTPRPASVSTLIPLRRVGRVEDVAQAALYLATKESAYVTGTEIVVDGGVAGHYVVPE